MYARHPSAVFGLFFALYFRNPLTPEYDTVPLFPVRKKWSKRTVSRIRCRMPASRPWPLICNFFASNRYLHPALIQPHLDHSIFILLLAGWLIQINKQNSFVFAWTFTRSRFFKKLQSIIMFNIPSTSFFKSIAYQHFHKNTSSLTHLAGSLLVLVGISSSTSVLSNYELHQYCAFGSRTRLQLCFGN